MINIAEITTALQSQIQNFIDIRDFKLKVSRGEFVNEDSSLTPWTGVYKSEIEFDPHTLGRGALNWLAQVNIDVVVQSHGDGGEKSEDQLGDAVNRVLRAIISDLTFSGTVDMIKKLKVTFMYNRNDTSTLDFQQALISIRAEVRAGS